MSSMNRTSRADAEVSTESARLVGAASSVGLVLALVPFVFSLRSSASEITTDLDDLVLRHSVEAQTFDYVAVPLGVVAGALGVLALLGVARAGEASPRWNQRTALTAVLAAVVGMYQALHGVGMV